MQVSTNARHDDRHGQNTLTASSIVEIFCSSNAPWEKDDVAQVQPCKWGSFSHFFPYCCTSQAIVDVVWLVAPFDWEMVPKPTRTRLTRGAVSYPYGWGENARWQGEGFFMNFLWQKKVDEAKWMWVIWLNGVSLINHALGNLCKLYDVCCVHSTFPVYECLL